MGDHCRLNAVFCRVTQGGQVLDLLQSRRRSATHDYLRVTQENNQRGLDSTFAHCNLIHNCLPPLVTGRNPSSKQRGVRWPVSSSVASLGLGRLAR